MYIFRGKKGFRLTEAEMEKAYFEKEAYFREEDAFLQLRDFNSKNPGKLQSLGVSFEEATTRSSSNYLLRKIAEKFEEILDYDLSLNLNWQNAISDVLSDCVAAA